MIIVKHDLIKTFEVLKKDMDIPTILKVQEGTPDRKPAHDNAFKILCTISTNIQTDFKSESLFQVIIT